MNGPPPEGFSTLTTNSPATDAWAPLYLKHDAEGVHIGTFVRPAMCNGHGTAHGGTIAALADYAMGLSYGLSFREAFGNLRGVVTTQMALDYIGGAPLGSWLQIRPATIHTGRSRGFTDARIYADGVLAARATAAFRALT